MQDGSGPTTGKRLEEAFVSEATSLEIAAIDLVGIFSNLAEDGHIGGASELCEDPDVHEEVGHAVDVLNVFQVEEILVLIQYLKIVLGELVGDISLTVFEVLNSLLLTHVFILFGSLVSSGCQETSHDICLSFTVVELLESSFVGTVGIVVPVRGN